MRHKVISVSEMKIRCGTDKIVFVKVQPAKFAMSVQCCSTWSVEWAMDNIPNT